MIDNYKLLQLIKKRKEDEINRLQRRMEKISKIKEPPKTRRFIRSASSSLRNLLQIFLRNGDK